MSKLRSCVSRTLVLVLMCLASAHIAHSQGSAAASGDQAEKKLVPVVNLALDASDEVLQSAHDAFLRHEIVVVEGATVKDMHRLIGLSLAEPKAPRENRVKSGKGTDGSNGNATKDEVEGILRVIAVRTTPEGQLHVFYGFTSGLKPQEKGGWTTGFQKWVNKESGIKEDVTGSADAAVSASNAKNSPPPELGDAGPDPGAWTHLSTTTNSMTSGNQNVLQLTATVYRLNSINSASDYYMVLTDAQDTPNYSGGWIIVGRGVVVRAQTQDGISATLFDHGPTGTLTSSTVGFSVGVSIGLTGPSVSASFNASWTQPSVVTIDRSGAFAEWDENFGGTATPVSTGTFLSHQSAIFVVPSDTTSLSIAPALAADFFAGAESDQVTVPFAPIATEPPIFSASPTNSGLAAGASTTLHVEASIPNSTEGLTWNLSGNNNTWLSVPSGPFSTSQDLQIGVNPGTPVGTSGFITVDTDPPFAAKSVESGPLQVQVTVGNEQPSTTTLSSSLNPSNSGQNVTLLAIVKGTASGTPTGTVVFRNGLTSLGDPVPLTGGQAGLIISTLPSGINKLNAAYSGDAVYGGSTSATLEQFVNGSGKVAAQIFPTLSQVAPYGAETLYLIRVFLASQNTSAPEPTGFYSISLAEHATHKTLVSFNMFAGPQITFAMPSDTALHAGFFDLKMHYSGDSSYAPADSSPDELYIAPSKTTTKLSTSVPSASLGTPVTLTAAVSAPPFKQINIVPTGSVEFLDGSQSLGIVTLSSGTASITTRTLSAGSHKLTAKFFVANGPDGFGNFIGSTDTGTLSIQTNGSQASVTASPNPSNFRDPITFQAKVTPQNNQDLRVPTGLVSFMDGTTILGTVSLVDGVASFTTSTVTGGAHTITAEYVGDAVFQPDTSTNYALQVSPINSVTNLSLSEPDPGVVYGEFVDLNATITDANNATLVKETGTVTFSYVTPNSPQPKILATIPLTQGKATYRTNALPAAQYNFFATYNGSNDFKPSASNPHTFSVNQASTTTAITSPASGTTVNVGQPIVVNFQVSVVPPGGGIISGESVTIQDPNFADSTCIGKLTGVSSPFTGSCTITAQTAGTRQLKAFFQALVNQNYQASSSLVVTDVVVQSVAPGTTTFSNLSPSQNITLGSSSINLSGVISAPGPLYPPANENVSITIGGVSRSVNIGAKGVFVFSNFPTNALAAGAYPITYSYAGDTKFSPANDASTTLTVNNGGPGTTTTMITPSVQQCVSGVPFVLTIQVTSTKGTPDGSVVLVRTNPDNTQTQIGSQILTNGIWAPAVNSSENFPMSPGTYGFTATYQGNSNFNSSVGTLSKLSCTASLRK